MKRFFTGELTKMEIVTGTLVAALTLVFTNGLITACILVVQMFLLITGLTFRISNGSIVFTIIINLLVSTVAWVFAPKWYRYFMIFQFVAQIALTARAAIDLDKAERAANADGPS